VAESLTFRGGTESMQEPEICRKCGTPRLSQAGYCVTCGTRFPKDVQYVRTAGSAPPPGQQDAPPPDALAPDAAPEPPSLRRWGIVGVAAALVIALAVGGFVFFRGGSGGGSAYALQFAKAKPGDTYRYAMKMDMDAGISSPQIGALQSLDMTMEAVIAMRVVSVDGDGVATIDLIIEEGTATLLDVTEELPRETTRIKIGPDGRLVELGGHALPGSAQIGGGLPGFDQFAPLLPDTIVKPGDTWEKELDLPIPIGEGEMELLVRGEFLRNGTIRGLPAAVIRTDSFSPLDLKLSFDDIEALLGGSTTGIPGLEDLEMSMGGNMRLLQTSWVDLGSGRWYRTKGSADFDLAIVMSGIEGPGPDQATLRLAGTMKLLIDELTQGAVTAA
jgi:hypothetical protein